MAASRRLVFARKLEKLAYLPALEVQNSIAKKHLDKIKTKGTNGAKNVLLFYEHYPVFTIGIRNRSVDLEEKERLEKLGAEFHYTNRGGLLTFHGPGQLVCYPILNLAYFKKSLKWYVASLERTLVETCKRFNVEATTTCDTGVWVKDNKIAAIGIHSSRWITTHGIALNCNIDLSWFNHFVPCGIEGKGVTSLSEETKSNIKPQDTIPTFIECFKNVFDCTVLEDNEEDQRWENDFQSNPDEFQSIKY
ncbi:octanoyl-[acyl-carrier-protein]:protein N-octanoyltransferase LIPT2, mitochondrial-like [Montipora capricornis]|uniref:octanoyl-[acyl-carrier-protein]:protein N-octanoyltransferase LIPT2, mitochondrial-like n=1 Tax=Montipora capricornis TaxID=246305 RepID=UPI0035F125D2